MTEEDLTLFRRHSGRARPPEIPAREAWVVAGRRSGKSRIAALVAVYLAAFTDYRPVLAPGEKGTVMLLAADRRQARVLMRYVMGLIEAVPMLAAMVAHRTAESVEMSNRVVIEIHTASFRAIRGYTIIAAICDELAFWRSEDSANPDTEIISALRPGMATVPGSLLLCISSAYRRRMRGRVPSGPPTASTTARRETSSSSGRRAPSP
jgi:phage terminase large subunit-like protein